MSCDKARGAILDHFRFGEELGACCDESLRHVESCVDCQREIAVDRGMARDLRRALHERVDGFEPSPAVWRAVRLQAADPEPRRWWTGAVELLARASRLMVPATAVVLAVVVTFSNGSSPSGDGSSVGRDLSSRLQWHEQLTATAAITEPEHQLPAVIPSPSIRLPRPSGDQRFADTPTAVKVFNPTPTQGGVIR